MYSTMHSFPLTITAILRHATRVHGARKVFTATGDGYRECTYAELCQRAAQLANALRRIGVSGDQRVATFMWNNAEHLTAYTAVPAMGAVLHTLNIRLFPEQIVYVANEAEDQVVLVDVSLAKLLAPILGRTRDGAHRDRGRRRRYLRTRGVGQDRAALRRHRRR